MRKHPSELAMEAYLLDPERSSLSDHLGGCETCKARLARMEKEGEDFRRFVLPATLDRVVEANSRRRFSLNGWMMAVPAMAAAAVLAVLVLPKTPDPEGPPEDYVGVKGGLALVVYTTSERGATTVWDGDKVNPKAALRFKVVHPGKTKACNLWLLSIDDSGQVSRIYPTRGEEGAHIAQTTPLPGGAVLDGKTGLERLYAVCSPEPIAYGQVESAVRASMSSGSIRKATLLAGLPKGAAQTTVLLDKKP
ncbi:MAG: hypothetical protein ACJ783_02280 [Myxococcales bacterium]